MIGRMEPYLPQSGLLVEVAHHTVNFMKATLKSVLQEYNPDEFKENLIAGVLDGIPLSGEDLLTEWKKQAKEYPRELSVVVVKRYAQIGHFWCWQTWLARGDNRMILYQSSAEVGQKLLEIKTKNLSQRLKHVYHFEPAEGTQFLTALVEETFDLIETHLPES